MILALLFSATFSGAFYLDLGICNPYWAQWMPWQYMQHLMGTSVMAFMCFSTATMSSDGYQCPVCLRSASHSSIQMSWKEERKKVNPVGALLMCYSMHLHKGGEDEPPCCRETCYQPVVERFLSLVGVLHERDYPVLCHLG